MLRYAAECIGEHPLSLVGLSYWGWSQPDIFNYRRDDGATFSCWSNDERTYWLVDVPLRKPIINRIDLDLGGSFLYAE
jgi:hypothetical protein